MGKAQDLAFARRMARELIERHGIRVERVPDSGQLRVRGDLGRWWPITPGEDRIREFWTFTGAIVRRKVRRLKAETLGRVVAAGFGPDFCLTTNDLHVVAPLDEDGAEARREAGYGLPSVDTGHDCRQYLSTLAEIVLVKLMWKLLIGEPEISRVLRETLARRK